MSADSDSNCIRRFEACELLWEAIQDASSEDLRVKKHNDNARADVSVGYNGVSGRNWIPSGCL